MGTKWILTPTFTPLNISGRQLWLDPTDNGSVNGGGPPPETLNTWKNKVVLSPTFTASGGMPWGATTQNDNPIVEGSFNTLSGNLASAPFTTWTLFMVFNLRELVDQMVLLGGADEDPVIKFIDDSNKFALQIQKELVPILTSQTYFADSTWYQICISFDGTTCALYVNGIGDTSDSVEPLTLPQDIVILGDSNANWPVLNGYLGDVILYNSAFSSGQVTLMSNYLKRKWAL